MTGPARRFDPNELQDEPGTLLPAELLAAAEVARELETIAGRDGGITEDFSDRVMAAIATEPTPQPAIALGMALRAGRARAALGAIGDSFRVAFGGGRPLAARGQALALALIVLVGVIGAGGGAAAGAARLLAPPISPTPSVPPSPPTSPSPSPTPSPSPSPSPLPTPTPPEATEPTATAEPTGTDDETPETTDDSSGPGSGDDSSGSGSGNSGSGSDDSGSGSDDSGSGD